MICHDLRAGLLNALRFDRKKRNERTLYFLSPPLPPLFRRRRKVRRTTFSSPTPEKRPWVKEITLLSSSFSRHYRVGRKLFSFSPFAWERSSLCWFFPLFGQRWWMEEAGRGKKENTFTREGKKMSNCVSRSRAIFGTVCRVNSRFLAPKREGKFTKDVKNILFLFSVYGKIHSMQCGFISFLPIFFVESGTLAKLSSAIYSIGKTVGKQKHPHFFH